MNWNPDTAHMDKLTSNSRTGYIITIAGCPLTWASKLQTKTTLSKTEVEFIALSKGLCMAIPIMKLIHELRERERERERESREGSQLKHCKVYEDNIGARINVSVQRIRPRTKPINNK